MTHKDNPISASIVTSHSPSKPNDLDALIQAVISKKFKPQDILDLTGLTYRQLNSWDNDHEMLQTERKSTEGWRTFTASEVLTLMICTDLQKEFGIAFEKIKWVKKRLQHAEWVNLDFSIRHIRLYDGDPCLLTDLKDFLAIFPKAIISKAIKDNKLGDAPLTFTNFLVFRVTPLVYRLVTNVFDGNCPLVPDQARSEFMRDLLDRLEALSNLKPNERTVISQMRAEGAKKIMIRLNDKKVHEIELEEELPIGPNERTWAEIKKALEADAFQTVQVKLRDNRTARITRRHNLKVAE